MKITSKEAMAIGALGVGLLILKDRNWDVNNSGTADDSDKGIILMVGAIAVFYLFLN